MSDGKGNAGGPHKPTKKGDSPARDWPLFWVQVAGVLAVVGTIIVSAYGIWSSGRDMAKGIGKMSDIAATMKNQQAAIIKQSEATENLASETNTVAAATMSEAETSATNAKTARQQLVTANRQLAQNIDLFAAGQRPIMDLALMSKENNRFDKPVSNVFMWIYSFENVGVGPAFNVHYDESLRINRRPFQTLHRTGKNIDPHGATHYSGASYILRAGERFPARIIPTLRVAFHYSDALGRRYVNTVCVRYDEFDDLRDCSQPDDAPKRHTLRRKNSN